MADPYADIPGSRQSTQGSTLDYVGRTVDVMAFQGVRGPGTLATLDHALSAPSEGGLICTGIQKLAQRWLIEFLTSRGSMLFLADRGCDFLSAARTGRLRTNVDVRQVFAVAAAQVKRNFLAEDEGLDVPDDELLAEATLISSSIGDGRIALQVNVVSAAGDTRQVILPIDTALKRT